MAGSRSSGMKAPSPSVHTARGTMNERVATRTFRSTILVAFMWLAAAGSIVIFGATAFSGPGPDPGPVDYVGTLLFGVVMAAGFLRGTRMRIEVAQDGVTVFNYLSTRRVAWEDVVDVTADYYGLRLVLANGEVVTASGIAKPNWAVWLRRRTKVDDVVDVIREYVARRT